MIDITTEGKLTEGKLRESIEVFYFAYRAFTSRADRILAERKLGRVHHRILYFVGRNPELSINALLDTLGVTKQALNVPLRQLVELNLVEVKVADHDRRYKQLRLTEAGAYLEAQLTGAQMDHLAQVFAETGQAAGDAWRTVMRLMPEKA